MPSSKYPDRTLTFPWLTASQVRESPFQIISNWRFRQRDHPSPGAPEVERIAAQMAEANPASPQRWMDYHFMQFLDSITRPTLALITTQGYEAEKLTDEMVLLDRPYWCGIPTRSIPRLDCWNLVTDQGAASYKKNRPDFHWGPLVLCVIPLREGTPYLPPRIISTKGQDPTAEDFAYIPRIVEQWGVPKVGLKVAVDPASV